MPPAFVEGTALICQPHSHTNRATTEGKWGAVRKDTLHMPRDVREAVLWLSPESEVQVERTLCDSQEETGSLLS